jgi:glutamate receptor, ionotropic, invertebrate
LQDIETFDLEDFNYNNVNITAFRLVDIDNPKVHEQVDQMKKFQHSGKDILNGNSVMQVRNDCDKKMVRGRWKQSETF